jgi:hypothetical protein
MTMENITESVKPPDASGKNDLQLYSTSFSNWLNSLYVTISTRINWLLGFFIDTGEFAPGFGPVSYIDFDITYMDGQEEGRLQWNSDDGTLEVGMPGGSVNLQIGQEMLVRVTNDTVNLIPNGTPVYVSSATGTNIKITPADADFVGGVGLRTFAVTTEDIPGSQKGYVVTQGFVRDIDTTFAVAAGLPVYLEVGGGFTTTAPIAPNITYLVGVVTIANSANGGEIYVIQTSIPNLNSLSDVDVDSISDTDKLVWNASNTRWENEPTPFGEIYTEDNVTETVISTIGTFTQVTIFDTNGESNNTTPDHTSDDITITEAGRYMITCSMAVGSAGGSANTLHIHVAKNNDSVEFANVHAHRRMSGGAGDKGSVSLSGIVNLQVDDTIELWITNDTSTQNYVVEDVTLSIIRIIR